MRAAILPVLVFAAAAHAQPFTDTFDSLAPWSVVASDGVRATIAPDRGPDGPCLRLDFNFEAGAGYCIVRRDVPVELPPNYRFSYLLRGDAPANNLEFKLVGGDNVWWINRRGFEFPKEWTRVTNKASHFSFAWGPSGGAKLDRLTAIEIAVAAAEGGKGSVYIDTLTFEPLPEPLPVTHEPVARFSTSTTGDGAVVIPASGEVSWRSRPDDASPRIEIDFGQRREIGGLIIDWDPADYGVNYDVSMSADGRDWEQAESVRASDGGRDFVPLPDAEGGYLRIEITGPSRGRGAGVTAVAIQPPGFAATPNAFIGSVARASARGRYPRAFLGEQPVWTVVGAAGSTWEGLLSGDGAFEAFKGGPSIEPFVVLGGGDSSRRLSWADAKITQSLDGGYLPIPTVSWDLGGLRLDITAVADGRAGSVARVAYTLTNTGGASRTGRLALVVRPYQVLPPWQELNVTGGVAPIGMLDFRGGVVMVNGSPMIRPATKPDRFIASAFQSPDPVEMLGQFGELLERADDPARLASGALGYGFDLAAGQSRRVVIEVCLDKSGGGFEATKNPAAFDEAMSEARAAWTAELNKVTLSLPASARHLADTFRTVQAHILINADGPAIQPGSRTYERSWIRDGALTSTALLATGHPAQAREFINWFASFQYPSGKIPCVVDSRGADPVPEHDSTGEYLYVVNAYYRFTRDERFLRAHWPRVRLAVSYIESLRAERMTDEYKNGSAEQRACYGLVPESISHEGYSAKPMHSYWDDFFILKGFQDAAAMAGILHQDNEHTRWTALAADFKECLYNSMRLAMETKGIDYIPGCVELGDFDATSTAIGLYPCDQLGSIPEPQLRNTFDRYFEYFENRRDGRVQWKDYTPYEVRLIGTFVRLGEPGRVHALLDFFLAGQTPPSWNQWPEVVARDEASPHFVGDIPHTWVGSDFLSAVRSMFVYERGEGLVLAAGMSPDWAAAAEGVGITAFPTEFGDVSYTLRTVGNTTTITLDLAAVEPFPAEGITIFSPDGRPVSVATVDGRVVPSGQHQITLTGPARVVWFQYESP